jgi:hypothetical protein
LLRRRLSGNRASNANSSLSNDLRSTGCEEIYLRFPRLQMLERQQAR